MKKPASRLITMGFLLLALGLCVYGASSGQAEDVLAKAATICLECIGLG